jgi:hypothetical protein
MYLRLPRSGQRCSFSGLSRSTLITLAVPCRENQWTPVVTSLLIVSRHGARRGVRLIDRVSLETYIRSCPAKH